MRFHELIDLEDQLQLLTKIVSDIRFEIESERQSKPLNQQEYVGDMPMDFIKRILDVAWVDLSDWLSQQGQERTVPKRVGDVKTVPIQSVTTPVKKTPVGRSSSPPATKPKRVKPVVKVKQKAKPQPEPKSVLKPNQRSQPNQRAKSVKLPLPSKSDTQPSTTDRSLSITGQSPADPVTQRISNPGQFLPRIKPYGTIGAIK